MQDPKFHLPSECLCVFILLKSIIKLNLVGLKQNWMIAAEHKSSGILDTWKEKWVIRRKIFINIYHIAACLVWYSVLFPISHFFQMKTQSFYSTNRIIAEIKIKLSRILFRRYQINAAMIAWVRFYRRHSGLDILNWVSKKICFVVIWTSIQFHIEWFLYKTEICLFTLQNSSWSRSGIIFTLRKIILRSLFLIKMLTTIKQESLGEERRRSSGSCIETTLHWNVQNISFRREVHLLCCDVLI